MGEDEKARRVGACGGYIGLQCPNCGTRCPVRFNCGHPLCGRCQGIRRWQKIQDLWPLVGLWREPRFLTLTFKSRHRMRREWRKRQSACLRKFLRHPYIAARMRAGVWAWETTYNQRLKMWHPHFHILFDGDYIPQAEIKRLWLEITGDSFIVHIRQIQGHGEAARRGALKELVKYITKSIEFSDDEYLIKEFLEGTRGMRRLGLFGAAKGYKPPERPATDKRWWMMDPFTGQGPKKIQCAGCGYLNFPEFWDRAPGLMSRSLAESWAAARGSPTYDDVDRRLLQLKPREEVTL